MEQGDYSALEMKNELCRKAPGLVAGKVVAALLLATGLTACQFDLHVYHETIVNDTSATVVARHCDNYCDSATVTFTLAPGQTADDNVEGGVATWFSLTDTSGAHVGCINLGVSPSEGLKVLVSTAGACP
jgi:hypothetical protein